MKHVVTGAIFLLLAPAAQAADEEVLATVNGKPIKAEELKRFEDAPSSAGAPTREQMVEELVTRELVYQDALARGLDKDPQVQKDIEEMRKRVLMAAAVRTAMEQNPVTDEEIKKEYDQAKSQLAREEYKARHILVDSEAKAKEAIAQLNKGVAFADVAKKHSSGPTGKDGGDLGWFTADQMVPPFAEAVRQLKKGTYTKTPVKTQYGWHVILLEDTRSVPAPGLAEMKDRIRGALQQQHVAAYITNLKNKATIDIKVPPVKAPQVKAPQQDKAP